jgi:hypothetical protein
MYGSPFNAPGEFKHVVDYAVDCLKEIEFDTLVFRGFSGAVVGPTVALQLRKPWALVRKPGDTAHSGRRMEGGVAGKYVILDDFIDTGTTINAIVEAVSIVSPCRTECVGVVLYEQSWCSRNNPDREHWEGRIGGLTILNWKDPPPKSKLDCNFTIQSAKACVGKMSFASTLFADLAKSPFLCDHTPVGEPAF